MFPYLFWFLFCTFLGRFRIYINVSVINLDLYSIWYWRLSFSWTIVWAKYKRSRKEKNLLHSRSPNGEPQETCEMSWRPLLEASKSDMWVTGSLPGRCVLNRFSLIHFLRAGILLFFYVSDHCSSAVYYSISSFLHNTAPTLFLLSTFFYQMETRGLVPHRPCFSFCYSFCLSSYSWNW